MTTPRDDPQEWFVDRLRRNELLRAIGHNPFAPNCMWSKPWDSCSTSASRSRIPVSLIATGTSAGTSDMVHKPVCGAGSPNAGVSTRTMRVGQPRPLMFSWPTSTFESVASLDRKSYLGCQPRTSEPGMPSLIPANSVSPTQMPTPWPRLMQNY